MKCQCYRSDCHTGHGQEPCKRPATLYAAWNMTGGEYLSPHCLACAACAQSHAPNPEKFVTTAPARMPDCDPGAYVPQIQRRTAP